MVRARADLTFGSVLLVQLDSVAILHPQRYMRCHVHAGRRDACADCVPRMYVDELCYKLAEGACAKLLLVLAGTVVS